MPSPRSADGKLLQTWRPSGPTGGRAKMWLYARRATVTLAGTGLTAWLLYLLFGQMFQPRSYFVYLCADEARQLAAPREYVFEAFSSFAPLEGALSRLPREEAKLLFGRMPDHRSVVAQLTALRDSGIPSNAAVVVCVSAKGIVRDGEPYLACSSYDPTAEAGSSQDALCAVDELLELLEDAPGATKLLVLDAGRSAYEPRFGGTLDPFVDELRAAYEKLNPATLWVMTASGDGEQSHASRALRRPVFEYMTALAMRGSADLNGDNQVGVKELHRYVAANVAAWVDEATDGNATQTPLLLAPGVDNSGDAGPRVVFTAGLPEGGSSVLIGPEMDTTQDEARQRSAVAIAATFMSTRISEFGVRPVEDAFAALTRVVVPGDEDEGAEDNGPQASGGRAERAEAQRTLELDLFTEAWRLTELAERGSPSPIEYAPDLWRAHRERLLWMENTHRSGELERDAHSRLVGELRRVKQSLDALNAPAAPPLRGAANVVDRVRERRPVPPIALADAPTLALMEAVASRDPAQSIPQPLLDFVALYDGWLRSGEDLPVLEKAREQLWQPEWAGLAEFAPLESLISKSECPPATIKQALRARRLGERAAATLAWGDGWAAAPVRQADGLRAEAERLLQDRAARDWLQRAELNLKRSESLYNLALEELATVEEARRLRDELSFWSRDYVRRVGALSEESQATRQMQDLIARLGELRAALADPRDTRAADLRSRMSVLRQLRGELERGLAPRDVQALLDGQVARGDAWRIESLLQSQLLASDDRRRCLETLAQVERSTMRDFRVEPPAAAYTAAGEAPFDRQREAAQLRAGWALFNLLAPEELRAPQDAARLEAADRGELVDSSERLDQRIAETPAAVQSSLAAARAGDASESPEAQVQRLVEIAGGLCLVDPADLAEPGAGASPAPAGALLQRIDHARWRNLLAAAVARCAYQQQDAPAAELAALRDTSARLQSLARRLPDQPSVPAPVAPSLRLATRQSEVLLRTEDSAEVDLDVTWQGSSETPIWLVAQHDERFVAVRGLDTTVWNQREVQERLSAAGGAGDISYPYNPEAAGYAPSFTLPQGRSRTVRVRVSRVQASGGDTTLVLKAVAQGEHLRQEVPVRLPGKKSLQLTVQADGRDVARTGDAYELFPNRLQQLTLLLSNQTGTPKSLQASLYSPQFSPPSANLPTGPVDPSSASRLLSVFGRLTPVAVDAVVEAPADDAPLPVLFAMDLPQNKALLGAESKEGPVRQDIPNGLLLVIIDKATNERTIQWLRFEVLRPRSYLSARGRYDPGAQELSVYVEAQNLNDLPRGNVVAEVSVDARYLSPLRPRSERVILSPPNVTGTLTAPLNGAWPDDGEMRAYVTVDGYPRAFEFRFRRATSPVGLAPIWNTAESRIVEPADGSEYAAVDQVAARLEIDAPQGDFNDPGTFVRVGVDANEDRVLDRDERAFTIRSDRQVSVAAQAPQPGATLAVWNRTGDFELSLPTAGIVGRGVNLLSQYERGEQETQKDYRRIVLDGEGPVIARREYREEGDEVILDLFPEDPLTGVKSIVGRFDLEGAKPQPALQVGAERWVLRLKTKDLAPNFYSVLITTTDNVGNAREIVWTGVRVQADAGTQSGGQQAGGAVAAAPPTPQVVRNRVSGTVRHGRNTIRNLEATLSGGGTADRQAKIAGGEFDFGLVPAGEYTLSVDFLSANRPRTKQAPVKVSDVRDSPTKVDIDF